MDKAELLLSMSVDELVAKVQELGTQSDAIKEERRLYVNVLNEKVRRREVLNRATLTPAVQPMSARSEVR